MKTVGIIAEYNPFHTGHQYQLEYTKEKLDADYAVIAMSGDYVQRGAPALLPKHMRAEMALRSGADLVLELPVSVSTASAEFFAQGAVSLLDSLGCVDSLCFGSEAGNISVLRELAQIINCEPAVYRTSLQENLRGGLSFPVSRSKALLSYLESAGRSFRSSLPEQREAVLSACSAAETEQLLSSPNNILGLEYCRALGRLHSTITPVTLKRSGKDYHDKALAHGEYASASAIRSCIERLHGKNMGDRLSSVTDCCALFADFIPFEALALLKSALEHNAFLQEEDFDTLLHCRLLSETADSLRGYLDVSPELAQRILKKRNDFKSFSQFAKLLNTREITQTRVQRALLHVLLDIRESAVQVPYARVLGFKKSSAALFREIKKCSSVPLVTKLADAPSLLSESGLKTFAQNTAASNIYQSLLSHKAGLPFLHEYEKNIVIV